MTPLGPESVPALKVSSHVLVYLGTVNNGTTEGVLPSEEHDIAGITVDSLHARIVVYHIKPSTGCHDKVVW